MRLAADGHLPLLHRLEQGALHLGGRAVDFVGQQQVGEDRAAVRRERALLGLEDHGADDVAGQQVGRELDALELHAQRLAERLDEERLGEAGHALEQHVAVGEQGDQQALDDDILADDGLGDFGAEFLGPGGTVGHGTERVGEKG